MTNVEARIEGSDKLTNIFGYWPSFHDAEVIALNFWRGNVDTETGSYDFPVLTVKMHLWEITNDVNGRGYLGRHKHTLTTIQFRDVDEFRMEGFNHQNAILGLDIVEEERPQGPTPVFRVTFRPAFGIGAAFICLRIGVLSAAPCTEQGVQTAEPSGGAN
jgi:hypothetical protein